MCGVCVYVCVCVCVYMCGVCVYVCVCVCVCVIQKIQHSYGQSWRNAEEEQESDDVIH